MVSPGRTSVPSRSWARALQFAAEADITVVPEEPVAVAGVAFDEVAPAVPVPLHAARATPEQIWIRDLASRLPFGKVVVAIANKHARQAWAMLARGEDYDAHAWLKHPMVQRPASKRRQQACS